MKNILIFILTWCVTPGVCQSQPAKVFATGCSTGSVIRLRWAPESPALWYHSLGHGYTVERVALTVNNKPVSPTVSMLSTSVLPAGGKLWDTFMDEDDYVAVAAQCILSTKEASALPEHFLKQATELESKFSFCLFAADHSLKAAQLSGLYYEDATAAGGTKYLYKIYSNIPAETFAADTGYVFIGIDDVTTLPKPRQFRAQSEGQKVTLTWDAILAKEYTSFVIERSDGNNRSFKPINNRPFLFTRHDHTSENKYYRTDSIGPVSQTYYYRLRGINAFAQHGPYSDTIVVHYRPRLQSAVITSVTIEGDSVRIKWDFPVTEEKYLEKFIVSDIDPGTNLSSPGGQSMPNDARSVLVPLSHSKYYSVIAFDKTGNTARSLPYFLSVPDTLAPEAPDSLNGRIDFSGRVFLKWRYVNNDELFGFHIYRSNVDSNFICISPTLEAEPFFTDSIALNSVTENIYYRVVAVDRSFNSSPWSETLVLKKPDIVVPAPPALLSVKSDSIGVTIKWVNSASSDAALHVLLRRTYGSDNWLEVQRFSASDLSVYIDSLSSGNIEYSMYAVDEAGLKSVNAPAIVVDIPSARPAVVDNVLSVIDINERKIGIFWEYTSVSGIDFLLYKSINGSRPRLYQRLHASERMFEDRYTRQDKTVTYMLAVVDQRSGQRSRLSKSLIITP